MLGEGSGWLGEEVKWRQLTGRRQPTGSRYGTGNYLCLEAEASQAALLYLLHFWLQVLDENRRLGHDLQGLAPYHHWPTPCSLEAPPRTRNNPGEIHHFFLAGYLETLTRHVQLRNTSHTRPPSSAFAHPCGKIMQGAKDAVTTPPSRPSAWWETWAPPQAPAGVAGSLPLFEP